MVAAKAHASTQTQDAPIVILRPTERHYEKMAALTAICYPFDENDDWDWAEYYRQQMAHFPEGQFIAVDTASDAVVGTTHCMRFDFDPTRPLLDSWAFATNYG